MSTDNKKSKTSSELSKDNTKSSVQKQRMSTLQKIKNDVFFIDQFIEKTNYKLNSQLAEINSLVEKNNNVISGYKKRKETLKNPTQKELNKLQDVSTTIFANNFSIIDKKIGLMEIHLKEVYAKLDTLGKSVSKLCDVLMTQSEES